MIRAAGASQYCVRHMGAAITRDAHREVHAGAKYRRMRSALTMCRIGAKRGVSAVGREA